MTVLEGSEYSAYLKKKKAIEEQSNGISVCWDPASGHDSKPQLLCLLRYEARTWD